MFQAQDMPKLIGLHPVKVMKMPFGVRLVASKFCCEFGTVKQTASRHKRERLIIGFGAGRRRVHVSGTGGEVSFFYGCSGAVNRTDFLRGTAGCLEMERHAGFVLDWWVA